MGASQPLRPLLVSYSDLAGGAARAGHRLFIGLRALGVDAQMFVQAKQSDHAYIHGPSGKLEKGFASLRPTLDQIPLLIARKSAGQFMTGWLADRVGAHAQQVNANIINLHEIRKGNLRIESLAKWPYPVVWTLHDMWALTGGCHYDQECGRYQQMCGCCPQLQSTQQHDLSRRIMQRKAKSWENANLTLVAPSRWLAECARQSTLFAGRRVEVIPYGLDTTRYRPIDRDQARSLLGLPKDSRLVLFLAANAMSGERKGFRFLHAALCQILADSQYADVELVIVGASAPTSQESERFKSHYLGFLHDDVSLALAYSAVDIFIAPSLQDNLPNTVMESLACGTPVLAFDVGGMPDMIDHQETGYLATPQDAASLAAGIRWLLADNERLARMGQAARQAVEERFPLTLQAERYIALYDELLNQQTLP